MFFNEISKFPSAEDGRIEIIAFLEACKGIVKFVELLGTLFSPVRSDIQGNIEKLSKIQHSDETKFSTVNDIVETEVKEAADQIGIDALLWLKSFNFEKDIYADATVTRLLNKILHVAVAFGALEFVHVFLTCIVDDSKQVPCSESLSPFFHKAYEEKLKPYHGWFVQKLFGCIVLGSPSRKSLLLLLAGGQESVPDQEILKEIESFLPGLGANIDTINGMYDAHNLVFNNKV